MFFGAQLRLKRIVFRGELYWLSYKGDTTGKVRTFKDFVEEQAKDILSLAEESLEYFLNNINDFLKKVNLLEQDIEKFKHYQTIIGKMNNLNSKIQNIDSYLPNLTYPELCTLSTVVCSFNPIYSILQNQSLESQVFSDLRASIQTNNKIKF